MTFFFWILFYCNKVPNQIPERPMLALHHLREVLRCLSCRRNVWEMFLSGKVQCNKSQAIWLSLIKYSKEQRFKVKALTTPPPPHQQLIRPSATLLLLQCRPHWPLLGLLFQSTPFCNSLQHGALQRAGSMPHSTLCPSALNKTKLKSFLRKRQPHMPL